VRTGAHAGRGQQITYFLEREWHVRLSMPKIYEILGACPTLPKMTDLGGSDHRG